MGIVHAILGTLKEMRNIRTVLDTLADIGTVQLYNLGHIKSHATTVHTILSTRTEKRNPDTIFDTLTDMGIVHTILVTLADRENAQYTHRHTT